MYQYSAKPPFFILLGLTTVSDCLCVMDHNKFWVIQTVYGNLYILAQDGPIAP